MHVLQVTAEIFPLLKTGGLADVAGALPAAMQAVGCEVRPLLPAMPAIKAGLHNAKQVASFATPWGDTVGILLGTLPAVGPAKLQAYLLDAPQLYDRPGNPYEDAQRQPYADNVRRFAALGLAAAHLAHGLDPHWQPDIVHGHDWHAGLAGAYLRFWPRKTNQAVRSVFTIHNLAYQGLFAAHHLQELGLPAEAFQIDGLEFHGQLSFMKAGLFYADHITTVSPTYAQEIQTAEQGFGLDGLLHQRNGQLTGVLNGVDPSVWNPATDPHIGKHFDRDHTKGKADCKRALQKEMGLAQQAGAPLFAVVSRLTGQKGLPLVLAGIESVVQQGGQLVVLGSGDAQLEQGFMQAAKDKPDQVAVRLGYDEALAHRIFAGSDITLVPSLFEPCGLTQMYGLLYGSLPLVRAVGGLADTVVDSDLATLEEDTATGFVFQAFDPDAYRHAVRRALALYRSPRTWAKVRYRAMSQNFNWHSAAQRYMRIFQSLT